MYNKQIVFIYLLENYYWHKLIKNIYLYIVIYINVNLIF